MPLPIAAIVVAVATPILINKGLEIKEKIEEKVSDEELDKIEPILSKLGLTREEILALDTEKKISNQVKARLDRLDKRIQDEIIQELQDCLDQDEYFEIDYKY
ncbi:MULTISPECIES: hypothetical protein [Moorena]|uniref:Uncharacterized protein n=1 Tax=Moorena producens 3L TaxID=489825 RepID=F4XW71_9CYAN|nr:MULTISPECIES: hypothetical protein [Moorena]NEQ18307.1 hypothetical protein [Moorena sp. SIO3E2]EGJ31056.1 hypothetical protein LYNGBM3L_42760 [Moorena producens 3L]NEP35535.1 hypothetical protein [Moorena sp. SIO3B2]NEP67923.1 hypothetical protein [Moorena sp. SIO3A5]OLT65818.1 hypothetical protein BI334_12940 [Moorena producens 3L]